MDNLAPSALAGLIAAALVLSGLRLAPRAWSWLRRDALVREQRRELVQARRTIQQLNKIMGNTETQVMPLSVSQKLGEMFGRK